MSGVGEDWMRGGGMVVVVVILLLHQHSSEAIGSLGSFFSCAHVTQVSTTCVPVLHLNICRGLLTFRFLLRVAVERLFRDTLNRHTTLAFLLQFFQKTEGGSATATPSFFPSHLIYANGSVQKSGKENDLSLLQRIIKKSDQNSWDDRKALSTKVKETRSKDHLITVPELSKAFSGVIKDMDPGPDQILRHRESGIERILRT